LAAEAFGWCSNLGAPAALVSGAVLATLSSTRNELTPRDADKRRVQFAKKTCRALLLSAFAFEVFCIFVTTVTGTMLLSHGDIPAGSHGGIHYHSPMGFMAYNHEFEYLTSRVTFLQGLFNWLAAGTYVKVSVFHNHRINLLRKTNASLFIMLTVSSCTRSGSAIHYPAGTNSSAAPMPCFLSCLLTLIIINLYANDDSPKSQRRLTR
jgi:hypothetical protein